MSQCSVTRAILGIVFCFLLFIRVGKQVKHLIEFCLLLQDGTYELLFGCSQRGHMQVSKWNNCEFNSTFLFLKKLKMQVENTISINCNLDTLLPKKKIWIHTYQRTCISIKFRSSICCNSCKMHLLNNMRIQNPKVH